jgi:hypothetical protein
VPRIRASRRQRGERRRLLPAPPASDEL